MDSKKFNEHLQYMQATTVDTLTNKAKEYATDDRLHNFKQAAHLQQTTPENALGGMMSKHTVSVYDMIRDTLSGKHHPADMWEEKIKDSINYLYLLWALVNEDAEAEESKINATERKPTAMTAECHRCAFYRPLNGERVCRVDGSRLVNTRINYACAFFSVNEVAETAAADTQAPN